MLGCFISVKLKLQSIDFVANVRYEFGKERKIIVDEIVEKHKRIYRMDSIQTTFYYFDFQFQLESIDLLQNINNKNKMLN